MSDFKIWETPDGAILQSYRGKDKIVYIPTEITIIDDLAFKGNTFIEKVVFGSNVFRVRNKAFSDCTNLKEVIFDDALLFLGQEVFYNCTSLEKIALPSNVFFLDKNTFSFCKNLKEVKLSEKIQKISERLFYKCESLRSIRLPESVLAITSEAFRGCTNLKTVFVSELGNTCISQDAFLDCADVVLYSKGEAYLPDVTFC